MKKIAKTPNFLNLIVFYSIEKRYNESSIKSMVLENSISGIYPLSLNLEIGFSKKYNLNWLKIFKYKTDLISTFGDKISFLIHNFFFDLLFKNLEKTLAKVDKIMADLEQGKGTMGKLIKDETMYTNFSKTSKELEKALNTASQNGKKIAKPTKILNIETITTPFSYINSIYSLLAAIIILIVINKKGIQITYFIFAGLLGAFFSLVGFFSLHEEILWNYNIMLFNPLLLLFAYFYWKNNSRKTLLFGQICIAFSLVYLVYILNKVQLLIVLPIVILHLFWIIKIVILEKRHNKK